MSLKRRSSSAPAWCLGPILYVVALFLIALSLLVVGGTRQPSQPGLFFSTTAHLDS